MHSTRSFDSAVSGATLRTAVELLRRVLREVPRAALPRDVHARITALVTDVTGAPAVDASDAPTVTERPKLRAVALTLKQYIVLDRAMRSPKLKGTFADLHDFVLAAGRGYHYEPPPTCETVETPPGAHGVRTIAFKGDELDELQSRAVDAGATSTELFILGCAFNWLSALRAKWPADADLNAHGPQSVSEPVAVIHFPKK
jgi:hypothetical protein